MKTILLFAAGSLMTASAAFAATPTSGQVDTSTTVKQEQGDTMQLAAGPNRMGRISAPSGGGKGLFG
ncbi:hypothetical protein CES85_4372 [Ochrobactrum quorumnocens]|uniref:Uncharacterized protein n=1 Tax=Ochrobactrum quorumnocens TaxID=271865 RepID=A0A248UB02_9HYPH|nr:hypothetical protein [[Ochrobactrum] quorumnocens]ASV83591.1 hypothetical protein CES85_4372 [[Ochrobactrum] quorumnocens]